jgi:hypothetical protein
LLRLHTTKGVPDGPFNVFGLDVALDQIVRGTRLHRFKVDLVTTPAGQHDHGRLELVPRGLPQ